MSILSKLNPFKKRDCCAVPLVFGNLDLPRSTVTGFAEVNGASIFFAGVVLPDEDDDSIEDAVEAAESTLRSHMNATGA